MFEGQIERQIQQQLEPCEERIAKLEKYLVALQDQVRHLTVALQEMQRQQEQKSITERDAADSLEPQMDVELQCTQSHQMGTSPPSASCVCYLPALSSDGCFDSASPIGQIGKSIYQLSTTSGVNGIFIMLDNPDVIVTAIVSVSQFVEPVYKVVNNASVYPRSIGTADEGSAVFENEIWCVMNKATVKFD